MGETNIMSSEIQFRGTGPFDLPVAQSSMATEGTNAVTLSFRLLAQPNHLAMVRIAIPNSQALELAAAIAQAVAKQKHHP